MAKRLTTLILRRCMRCRRTFERERWPWRGQLAAESHGLCPWCSMVALDELAPRPAPESH